MKKGAMDFIEKPFDEAELRKLVERMLDKARSESTSVQQQRAAAERLGKLTAREHQVLERIIAGRLNKQIADDLGISIKTVEAHRANIMEKLSVNTVADLLRLALSNKPQSVSCFKPQAARPIACAPDRRCPARLHFQPPLPASDRLLPFPSSPAFGIVIFLLSR